VPVGGYTLTLNTDAVVTCEENEALLYKSPRKVMLLGYPE
jgi:hypothetical protein